jgi:hypothetical protein
VEQALRLAGENRADLEKVLEHYLQDEADSLKYQAACFLIENMPGHYSYSGESMNRYYAVIDSIFSSRNILPHITRLAFSELTTPVFRRLEQNVISSKLKVEEDVKNIKSSLLISHIDHAFESFSYPWTQRLSFSDFCEYVLPYRILHEPLEDWRELYKEKLSTKVDSLVNINANEFEICKYLSASLANPSNILYYAFLLDLPASTTLKLKIGTCKELSPLGIYTLRTFGMPVTYDFTPQWGNRSMGHNWNLLLSTNPATPFSFGDYAPFGEHLNAKASDKLAKVYRIMYSIQKESLVMQNVKEAIPALFKNPFLKDVSSDYFETIDIKVNINENSLAKKKIAYIMVFNNKEWTPIHWAKIKNHSATFSDMAKGCAYIVMCYDNNRFYPLTSPFYIDNSGQMKILSPDETKHNIVYLKRKYHDLLINDYVKELPGGRFQVANDINFTNAIDLYSIDSIPEAKYHTIELSHTGKYKYFRYMAAEGSSGSISEIQLYNDRGKELTGEIIGTEDSLVRKTNDLHNNTMPKSNVFDGEPLTYFETEKPYKAWVGLVFKEKENIRKIKYLPRNDDNFIRENEIYELFYWNKDWKSLGQQTGKETTQLLMYENVPENALLLLRDITKGVEERIFTYEKGQQVWW